MQIRFSVMTVVHRASLLILLSADSRINPQTAQANTPPQPRGLRDCIITDDCTVLITATGTSQPRHSNPPPGIQRALARLCQLGSSELTPSRQERGHQKRAGLSYSNLLLS